METLRTAETQDKAVKFTAKTADIIYKGNEYELTDSVMVSMEWIGAVALSLLWERSILWESERYKTDTAAMMGVWV